MKAGKVWGTTELIEANGALEFHRIEMKAGGVCSKHLHRYKWNGFYVVSGRLLIRNWRHCQDLIDETILEPGDYHAVGKGRWPRGLVWKEDQVKESASSASPRAQSETALVDHLMGRSRAVLRAVGFGTVQLILLGMP